MKRKEGKKRHKLRQLGDLAHKLRRKYNITLSAIHKRLKTNKYLIRAPLPNLAAI
jgi:hypothetical protein